MSRFSALSLGLITIFALLIGVALRIGQGQPTPERIERLHLADCALPCWNGITPGVSSISEAKARIDAALPDFESPSVAGSSKFLIWTEYGDIDRAVRVVSVFFQDNQVITVSIGTDHTSEDMPRLSEVLAIFGVPTCVEIDEFTGYSELYYENAAHQPMLDFTVFRLRWKRPSIILFSASRRMDQPVRTPLLHPGMSFGSCSTCSLRIFKPRFRR